METEAHIIVRGLVQGVGFRVAAQRVARSIGVGGYVRNLSNGDVEIVAQGDTQAIDRLLAWARHGPRSARVDDVGISYRQPATEYRGFDIR